MIFKPLPSYAGTLELASGRWAWVAFERGDFVRVSFQHLGRNADLMEAVIGRFDFTESAVEEIGRTPAVRWWHDEATDIMWELRVQLRTIPARIPGFARRELVFAHVGMEPRYVLLPTETQLGELTNEQLRFLGRNAQPESAPSTRPTKGGGQVGAA